ncbi:hypothetical protein CRG98_025038 [Punica granatum]|uniref:Integrase catalytic domain-containing protein n=1 Tax=Punica granatum TaxID=22663 RepID=A0A2I0JE67_PUNGR|nr:hypothetical protein CRG98_025038 [Punica granatum]
MLKKGRVWEWTDRRRAVFDRLKQAVMEEPVLVLPNFEKLFEVETDASDYAIDGVLMQEGHLDYLVEYSYVPKYKPGLLNFVADPLSRKAELANIVSRLEYTLLDRIKEGLRHDAKAKVLLDYAQEGKTRRFWCEGDLLYFKEHPLYVPLQGKLRHEDKQEQKSSAGLLQPLPISECPWESGLSKFKGCQALMVAVDRFSKYASFLPTTDDCMVEEAAKLFMKYVVKYWGVPRTIVRDRDPRFT